jgi:hypothetical protein
LRAKLLRKIRILRTVLRLLLALMFIAAISDIFSLMQDILFSGKNSSITQNYTDRNDNELTISLKSKFNSNSSEINIQYEVINSYVKSDIDNISITIKGSKDYIETRVIPLLHSTVFTGSFDMEVSNYYYPFDTIVIIINQSKGNIDRSGENLQVVINSPDRMAIFKNSTEIHLERFFINKAFFITLNCLLFVFILLMFLINKRNELITSLLAILFGIASIRMAMIPQGINNIIFLDTIFLFSYILTGFVAVIQLIRIRIEEINVNVNNKKETNDKHKNVSRDNQESIQKDYDLLQDLLTNSGDKKI